MNRGTGNEGVRGGAEALTAASVGIGPAALAVTLGVATGLLGWRGMDFAAQLYRAASFRAHGFTLWDSQWYGGHWTVSYSVLFPAAAGVLGVQGVGLVSAAAASWTFDRLLVAHFGPSARAGSVAFAAGTAAQLALGQVPFMMGEALALAALSACSRRRWGRAAVLAALAGLSSPVAAAFLCLALLASALTQEPSRRRPLLAIVGAAGAPLVVLGLAFPGLGPVRLLGADVWCIVALCTVLVVALPPSQRTLRLGTALYAVATVAVYFVPNSMGGSVTRLGAYVGVPLLVAALWPVRAKAAILVVGLFGIWAWAPALAVAANGLHAEPSEAAYYRGLIRFLKYQDQPSGRVEVIPTSQHWEAAFVAPEMPLARGWERQVDTAENPVFYEPGALDAASYRSWLLANGVRWVALARTSLDYAGQPEARLVTGGIDGLQAAWHDGDWTVWSVDGAPGIVSGPATLTRLAADSVIVDAHEPADVVLRVHWTPNWKVTSGRACLEPTPDGWVDVHVTAPGPVRLDVDLVGHDRSDCPP